MKTTQPENVQKWVDALRSGEFEQTRGALHRVKADHDLPVGHCCLGVACEISGVITERKFANPEQDVELYDGEGGILPPAVAKWLGIDAELGDYVDHPEHGGRVWLGGLNDTGMSFTDIADLIQKEFL